MRVHDFHTSWGAGLYFRLVLSLSKFAKILQQRAFFIRDGATALI